MLLNGQYTGRDIVFDLLEKYDIHPFDEIIKIIIRYIVDM